MLHVERESLLARCLLQNNRGSLRSQSVQQHFFLPLCVNVGFQMVETLYNNGANSIWEHSLLDPASVMSGRRKASPQDKVQ